jgi:cobalt-zinc-cadmium efflux system membrane fusion protein
LIRQDTCKNIFLAASCILTLLPLVASAQVLAQSERGSYLGVEPSGQTAEVIPLSSLGRASIGLQVAPVKREPLPLQIATTGKIEAVPTRVYYQHALLTGRVIQVLVTPGQYVEAGKALVLIDSPEINQLAAETLQIKAQLEADIAQQKAQLDAEIKQAATDVNLWEANAKRDKGLFDEGIGSQKAWQQSNAQQILSQSKLSALKTKRDLTLKALKIKLDLTFDSLSHRLAQLGVSPKEFSKMIARQHTILVVPVTSARAGVVTDLKASAGQSISPNDMLCRIADLRQVWATADIYEDDMARIKVGQKVLVKVAALPESEFSGTLTYIGAQVDPQTRTLPVRAELANPEERLKPDMFADLFVQTTDPIPAILLPQDAVILRQGHHEAFVEVKGGFRPTIVQVGRTFGDKVEIVKGLQPGDPVVMRGAFQLEAETLKSHGNAELFVQATEGERSMPGSKEPEEQENKNPGMSTSPLLLIVIVILAFVFGFIVSTLWRRPTKVTAPNSTSESYSANLSPDDSTSHTGTERTGGTITTRSNNPQSGS